MRRTMEKEAAEVLWVLFGNKRENTNYLHEDTRACKLFNSVSVFIKWFSSYKWFLLVPYLQMVIVLESTMIYYHSPREM